MYLVYAFACVFVLCPFRACLQTRMFTPDREHIAHVFPLSMRASKQNMDIVPAK